MGIKVAINGFGRVGRYIVRACIDYDDIDIVAINSRAKPEVLAHLLKYDSVHGIMNADVSVNGHNLMVNGKEIAVTAVTKDIRELPWKQMGIDIVLESTGKFKKKDELIAHIQAGPKRSFWPFPARGWMEHSSWGSTKANTIRRNITLFPMHPAPPTVWRR
jgi:glyceraldehyde 3-phosphate dehydrogenase